MMFLQLIFVMVLQKIFLTFAFACAFAAALLRKSAAAAAAAAGLRLQLQLQLLRKSKSGFSNDLGLNLITPCLYLPINRIGKGCSCFCARAAALLRNSKRKRRKEPLSLVKFYYGEQNSFQPQPRPEVVSADTIIYLNNQPLIKLTPAELNLFGMIFEFNLEFETLRLSEREYTLSEVFQISNLLFESLILMNEKGYISSTSLFHKLTDEISSHLKKSGYEEKALGCSCCCVLIFSQ
jgi:hypothetical protein